MTLFVATPKVAQFFDQRVKRVAARSPNVEYSGARHKTLPTHPDGGFLGKAELNPANQVNRCCASCVVTVDTD
jgi:hypothetical protein